MAYLCEVGDANPGASVSEKANPPISAREWGVAFGAPKGLETSQKKLSNLFCGQGHESYVDKNTNTPDHVGCTKDAVNYVA